MLSTGQGLMHTHQCLLEKCFKISPDSGMGAKCNKRGVGSTKCHSWEGLGVRKGRGMTPAAQCSREPTPGECPLRARHRSFGGSTEKGLSAETVKLGHLVHVLDLPLQVLSPWANYLTSSVTQFPHLLSKDNNNIYLVGCCETLK